MFQTIRVFVPYAFGLYRMSILVRSDLTHTVRSYVYGPTVLVYSYGLVRDGPYGFFQYKHYIYHNIITLSKTPSPHEK